MNDRDRRESGRLMLISPERVFYAGLLGRPRQRSSGGFNIYAAIAAASLTINDGQSDADRRAGAGAALCRPQCRERTSLDHLPGDRTGNGRAPRRWTSSARGFPGPEGAPISRGAFAPPTKICGCGSTAAASPPPSSTGCFFGEALPDRDIDRAHQALAASLERLLRQQDDARPTARRCGGTVAVALPASVQAADRRLVPGLSRLEAGAASAAFRQRGHQPRASRAGHRLSQLDAFQPLDPAFLRLAAARDLFRLAGSRDLPQRSGRAAPLALARGRKKRNETPDASSAPSVRPRLTRLQSKAVP